METLSNEELGYIIGALMVISLSPMVSKEEKDKSNKILEILKKEVEKRYN